MRPRKTAVAAVVVITLGAAGFFVGWLLVDPGGGTEAQQPRNIDSLDDIKTKEAALQEEPRFAGELLGIYIAPSLEQIPASLRSDNEQNTDRGCRGVPLGQANALDFSRDLVMPNDYILAQQDSANTGSNPWALACGDQLTSRGWDYAVEGANGIPATVSIVRIVTSYDTQDVAQSQVSTETVAGRQALVIRPATTGGLGQRHLIYFPEPFGMTSIQTFNLPEDKALEVAAAVAGASE